MARQRTRARALLTRTRLAAGAAVLMALPVLFYGLPSASASSPPPTFSVSVAATPETGGVPLTVTLNAAVSSGTPIGVVWTFGDGSSWAGSGLSALSLQHRYSAVGSFVASATVTESGGVATGSTTVSVVSGPLIAVIAATPSSGVGPLSVTFRAVVSGGTGTYTTWDWTFGDGGFGAGPVVQYTYTSVGHFVATLTVIDSTNQSAVADYAIDVSPSTSLSGLGAAGPTVLATVGVVGAGLTFGVFYGVRRRRTARAEMLAELEEGGALPPGIFGPAAGLPVLSASGAAPAAASEALPEAALPASSSGSSPSSLSSTSSLPLVLPTRTRPARAPGEEPRRWSRDLVAYLGGLPTLGPDDIPTLDWTQKGMSDRLGTGQNQVSNVLRRLVHAGLVVEELQHVQGQPRRLKVYHLTLRGEALAREVRRRKPASNPNLLRRDF